MRRHGFPARACRRKPGVMNKLEAAYCDELARLQDAGEILEWAFEAETLKLADGVRYTPDFRVITRDGLVEFHETKGFMRDDARVKLRVAAALHPYTFRLVKQRPKRDGGGWDVTEV